MKDWKHCQASTNMLESMAILIKANHENTQLQTEYLRTVVKKMVDPLVENITWIKQEKAKSGSITEK